MIRSYNRSARSDGDIELMSGARPAGAAAGFGAGASSGGRLFPNRWPAIIATSARSAIAATDHGNAVLMPLWRTPGAPAGLPHR
jgi:hypothetical protein